MFDAPDIAEGFVANLRQADAIARGTYELPGMDGSDSEQMLLASVSQRPAIQSLLRSIDLAPGQPGAAAQRVLRRIWDTLTETGTSAAEPRRE